MTEDEIFAEFLGRFGDKDADGQVSKAEWNDYYAGVSSSVDNDDEFVLIMNQAWKMEWISCCISLPKNTGFFDIRKIQPNLKPQDMNIISNSKFNSKIQQKNYF